MAKVYRRSLVCVGERQNQLPGASSLAAPGLWGDVAVCLIAAMVGSLFRDARPACSEDVASEFPRLPGSRRARIAVSAGCDVGAHAVDDGE